MYKNILIFLAGAGIGAGGMYLGVKKHFENLYNDEIKYIRDRKAQEDSDEDSKIGEQLTMDISAEFNDEPVNTPDTPVDYGACFVAGDKTYKAMDIPQIARDASNRPKDDIDDVDIPYVISPEDFYQSTTNDKVTLTYFEEDGVFIGTDEEVVPDGYTLVGGSESLEAIGTYEEDVVYVRNPAMGVDYEVIKDSGSYAVYAGE